MMSRISATLRWVSGIGGWGTMMRPARRSAVASGRAAIDANVGTSGLAVLADPGATMWQALHMRVAISCPRFASPARVCADAGALTRMAQIPEIASMLLDIDRHPSLEPSGRSEPGLWCG